MEAVSDSVLGRAILGDREALTELLKRHGPAARARLAGSIPQRWQAVLSEDDVIQQTYADAVAHIAEFDSASESAFAKWLATIAQRNLRDALKMLAARKRGGDRRRVEGWSRDDSYVALCELLSSPGTSPSGGAARQEAQTALRAAMARLHEAYARVIELYDLDGRPVDEVAAALQRSPGAVFMLRARAHERLHVLLGRTSAFFGASA